MNPTRCRLVQLVVMLAGLGVATTPAATDEEIVEWVGALTPDTLAAPLRFSSHLYGGHFEFPLWFLLAHFFNHQTHHRGQATTLLAQCGVDYGITDLLWLPHTEWMIE